jgi:hypothetical protein
MEKGTLIGYAEFLTVSVSVAGILDVNVKGFVEDIFIARFELRVIDGVLYIFRLHNNKKDKFVYYISNNFIIKDKTALKPNYDE